MCLRLLTERDVDDDDVHDVDDDVNVVDGDNISQ